MNSWRVRLVRISLSFASTDVPPSLLIPDLPARFANDQKLPRSVIVVGVEKVLIHCGRAVHTAHLWDPSRFVTEADIPDITEIFESHVAYCPLEACPGGLRGLKTVVAMAG